MLHQRLASDGAIFVSIDDNEAANLRLMLDEIQAPRRLVWNATFRMAGRCRARLSRDSQLMNLVSRLADLVGNMYAITEPEVKEYIRRVVAGMATKQIRDWIEPDVAYMAS